MIDSGADRSILPAEIAEMLGAPWQALQSGEGHSRGAGGSFETRVLDATLKWRGWLICESVVVAQPGSLPWALLGRSDFFQRFDVRFNWHHNPPWVQVDPVPPRSQTKR
jgi:predicted aspartyl protease